MDGFRYRWRCIAAVGMLCFLTFFAIWHFSHKWMVWYQPRSLTIALHYGAIGFVRDPSIRFTHSLWSAEAWHATRMSSPCTIWFPEVDSSDRTTRAWYPLWPLVAISGIMTLVGVTRPYLLHWTRCRGCGYRRAGITYDLPCPECGCIPKTGH